MKLGLRLVTVLKISVAKFLYIFVSIEVFLLFSSSVWLSLVLSATIILKQRLWIFSIVAVDLQAVKCHTSAQ